MKVVSKLFKNCPLATVLKAPVNMTINKIIYIYILGGPGGYLVVLCVIASIAYY